MLRTNVRNAHAHVWPFKFNDRLQENKMLAILLRPSMLKLSRNPVGIFKKVHSVTKEYQRNFQVYFFSILKMPLCSIGVWNTQMESISILTNGERHHHSIRFKLWVIERTHLASQMQYALKFYSRLIVWVKSAFPFHQHSTKNKEKISSTFTCNSNVLWYGEFQLDFFAKKIRNKNFSAKSEKQIKIEWLTSDSLDIRRRKSKQIHLIDIFFGRNKPKRYEQTKQYICFSFHFNVKL